MDVSGRGVSGILSVFTWGDVMSGVGGIILVLAFRALMLCSGGRLMGDIDADL